MNVKVFIIDEVSMVSSLNLTYIHLRLDEIYGGGPNGLGVKQCSLWATSSSYQGAPVFQSVPTKVLSLRIGCIGKHLEKHSSVRRAYH